MKMYSHVCHNCAAPFTNRRPTAKYCSITCKSIAQTKKWLITCSHCGGDFFGTRAQRVRADRGVKAFCSPDCFRRGMRVIRVGSRTAEESLAIQRAREKRNNADMYQRHYKESALRPAQRKLKKLGLPKIPALVECFAAKIKLDWLLLERKKHER